MTVDEILDNTIQLFSCGYGTSSLSSGTMGCIGYGCGEFALQPLGVDPSYGYGHGRGNFSGDIHFKSNCVK